MSASAAGHLKDMGTSIDKLNHLFNDVYLRVLENDTALNEVNVTCKTTLSHQSHLTKISNLQTQYQSVETLNIQLKQQLFEQATEYKRLQDDFEVAKKMAETHMTKDYKLGNLEKIVDVLRKDFT